MTIFRQSRPSRIPMTDVIRQLMKFFMQHREVSFTSRSTNITLKGNLWEPNEPDQGSNPNTDILCIFVHPWGVLGGSSANTAPFAGKLARDYGIRCLTFDLRGVGGSGGSRTYSCRAEIDDVVGACDFALASLRTEKLLIIGSSAGAAIGGSMIDTVDSVVGYVGIGYTFGWASSLIFGSHFKAVLSSRKPKLFIMGGRDTFTSVEQLRSRLRGVEHVESMVIDHCGHFDLENASRVAEICDRIFRFVHERLK